MTKPAPTPRTDALDDEHAPDTNGHEGWKPGGATAMTETGLPEEPTPIGWIRPDTAAWLSDPTGRGPGIFYPNRNGAYGGVPIYGQEAIDALRAAYEKAISEGRELREKHGIQLASISVAAMSNTRATAKFNRLERVNPYWTAAYQDVLDAVEREMKERERAESAEHRCLELTLRVEALEESEKAGRKDAERYRWLRERPSFIGWDWWNPPVPKDAKITPEFMDALIDAALGAKP